jgi:Flp pilus assembly pilin Flp
MRLLIEPRPAEAFPRSREGSRRTRKRPRLWGIDRSLKRGDENRRIPFPAIGLERKDTPMDVVLRRISLFRRLEHGQTMAEYAVVLGVITLAVVAAFAGLSGQVGTAVTDIVGRI